MKEDPGVPLLGCVRCSRRFSQNDILSGLYQIETFVCSYCYAEMQQASYEKSCFGKPMLRLPTGRLLFGWNSKAWECTQICPDRNLCRKVLQGDLPDPEPELEDPWNESEKP